MASNFNRAEVGDLVWSTYYGCGEVKSLDHYNLKVTFPNKEGTVVYDYAGCQLIKSQYDKTQTLSLVSDILTHLPKKSLKVEGNVNEETFKKGEIVLVRDTDQSGFMMGVFMGFSGDMNYPYKANRYVERTENWKYCIPYKGHEDLIFEGE